MNRAIPFVSCLLTAFFLAACANGIHSKTSADPSSASPTPAEVSSSAQVVKINTTFMPRSSSTFGDVALVISPGFHINANPATFQYLIATDVQPGKADGISIGEIVYPPPTLKKFPFAEKELAVYEGQVIISLPLGIASTAKGQRSLPIKVRVQACDHEKCYPPSTIETSMSIDLDLPHR